MAAPTGAGSPGWLSTGASTAGSTAIASANPPVRHMPTAPTPGPPHSTCASQADSARNHETTGLVRSASTTNSREMQIRAIDRTVAPVVAAAPGRPKSDGRYTR